MVFHAYVYPVPAHQTKVDQAGELGDEIDPFSESEANFSKRNAIWSMCHNTVYIPNCSDWAIPDFDPMLGHYPDLLTSRTCTIDQMRVGVEMIALNYFPKESVRLFLKQ